MNNIVTILDTKYNYKINNIKYYIINNHYKINFILNETKNISRAYSINF